MKRTVTITLRLTSDEKKTLDRVARALKTTPSEALRSVLREEAAKMSRVESLSAHDRLKRYIPAEGSARGRRKPSALNSGEQFAKLLLEKHRALRPD
jgi:hypothetical protein